MSVTVREVNKRGVIIAAIAGVNGTVEGGAVDRFFFFQAEDGIRDYKVTGVQTCALPICSVAIAVAYVLWPPAALATLLLLARCVEGIIHQPRRAQTVGMMELAYGAAFVVIDRKSVV